MSETDRLAKRVAEIVPCSRAQAIQYIEGGWVTVNGTIVEEPGFRVSPQEPIELLPQASLAPVEPVTILLHKPAAVSATAAAELIEPGNRAADDRSGARFLKHHVARLTMVDSLETAASGLMVFTQDWRVVRKLVDDAAKIEHEYIVEVTGDMVPDGLALLNQAQIFGGKPIPPVKVSWQNETRLRFALKAGSNELVRRLCEKVGLTVVSMKRIRVGRIPMAGLAAGQWRYLMGYERF
jgi:23S rRNA pseudouridine2604 synthase